MGFAEAYELADEIRSRLDGEEITSTDLAQLVGEELKGAGLQDEASAYAANRGEIPHTQVIGEDGTPQPYSKGLLSRSLEICGLDTERSFRIASSIERRLVEDRLESITSDELTEITRDLLRRRVSRAAASRYDLWLKFTHDSKPMALLIGGTTGTGKSTIAAEVAHRLDIIRAQSTDMLREVMRLLVSDQLTPTLHRSTFDAWKVLPGAPTPENRSAEFLKQGFLMQADQVSVATAGVIQRAATERVSLIVEGIHIHPGVQAKLMERTDIVVVPIVLAVLKKKQLRKQLRGRGREVASRRSERYLEHFDEIWQMQSYLVSEADEHNITIIENESRDRTVRSVLDTVVSRLSREYSGNSIQSGKTD